MEFIIFIVYLILTVLAVSGAWIPSILAIKIYLVIVTVGALVNLGAKS